MKIEIINNYLKSGMFLVVNNNLYLKLTAENLLDNFNSFVKLLIRRKLKLKLKLNKTINGGIGIPRGDILHIRKEDNQIIVIDKPNYVYRRYTDTHQFEIVKKGHAFLENYYNISPLQFIDENLTKEKYIEGKLLTEVSIKNQFLVFEKILMHYRNAIKNESDFLIERINVESFLKAVDVTSYPQEMKNYIYNNECEFVYLYSNIKWAWSHGDLTPKNIIFNTSSEYRIIDGERCEILPVFYDIANLMNGNSLMCNNDASYEDYFSGKYDDFLGRIINKTKVSATDRKVIILIMLIIKSVVAWDSELKRNDKVLMFRRWNAVRKYIL